MRRVEWVDSIFKFGREEWDALASPRGNPALSWGYLAALEESGSVAPKNDWTPHHYAVYEDDPGGAGPRGDGPHAGPRGGAPMLAEGRAARPEGSLIACAPVYVRNSLEGEFVFDYAFWEAAGKLGRPYFPRLVAMSPLTPTRSFALLVAPGLDADAEAAAFARALEAEAAALGCASANLNHSEPGWTAGFSRASGWGGWKRQSFYWDEPGVTGFDQYLARFDKNQRRNIRRERASLAGEGLRIEAIAAPDAETRGLMWDYYLDTNGKFGPWAARFLEPGFFDCLADRLPAGQLYFAAYECGRAAPVALSMLLKGERFLLGRYWGTARYYRDLHFNLCYYEPLEWLFAHGPRRFDPGMGSEHKARRGFRSEADLSFHHFRDPLLRRLLELNLPALNGHAERAIAGLNAGMPVKDDRDREVHG